MSAAGANPSAASSANRLVSSDLAYALLKASEAMGQVLREGRSLDRALADSLKNVPTPQAQGAVRDLAYFGLRHWGQGQGLTQLLTGKPSLKPAALEELLALGFALLWDEEHPKYPAHTVVDQMVKACASSPRLERAKGLVNACLRNFLRDAKGWREKAIQNPLAVWNFPAWWVSKVQQQHPDHWQHILQQANTQPPMVLRVNRRCNTAANYVQRLHLLGMQATVLGEYTVLLNKPVPVSELPGFQEGQVSVQDSAAQMAAELLNPQNGQRILDACAAPGGKTGHLLELADIDLLALDSHAGRLQRVEESLERIMPTAGDACTVSLAASEAQDLNTWWDGQFFDAILADLPCSGSGIVRRHPDIRWLRQASDVAKLSHIQHKILDSLWSVLKPGGTLLLVTCSIFSEEGPLLLKAFLDKHADALALPAPGTVLPVPNPVAPLSSQYCASPDGFFYAKLIKTQPS